MSTKLFTPVFVLAGLIVAVALVIRLSRRIG